MTDKKWRKISEKKYELLAEDGAIIIDVPYGKVEMIFQEFLGNNGVIDPATGAVQTDLLTLITSFGIVGNIVLTKFDLQGNVAEEGNCKALSPSLIPPLFEVAIDVIENFTKVISEMEKNPGMTDAVGMGKKKRMAN